MHAAPTEPGRSIAWLALALMLMWLRALTMPAAQAHLPPEAQGYLNTLCATIALALTVTLAAIGKPKHD